MSDDETYLPDDETEEDDAEVPADGNIDEYFRALDDVTENLYEENLLGPNTYRSVQNAANIAKQGKNLSKNKGKARDMS